ncbi:MAG: fasciclin domain-containing protein [Chitinophagaceae bacterium]|nr:fasciclin domain-containing protein [Chitinophagaceae bacterium]
MKKVNLIIAVLLFSLATTSCKKDYIVGGQIEDVTKYAKMTTFDVLKSNPDYDTLVQVIEAANMVDEVNKANTTFFAPSDYAILNYLASRTFFVQKNYDATAVFGLDSLKYYLQQNINNTRDSLKMYLIGDVLSYEKLTNTGAFFTTNLSDTKVVVSYEYVRDFELGYSSIVSSVPRIIYYSFLWYPYDLSDLNPAGDIPEDAGVRTRVIQSGLVTQNGIIDKLEPAHILFFYNTKK